MTTNNVFTPRQPIERKYFSFIIHNLHLCPYFSFINIFAVKMTISQKCFSPVEFVWFFLIIIALALSLISLVTERWLDEKYDTGGNLFVYQRQHGLWKICTNKIILGQQITKDMKETNLKPEYDCINRFARGCPETGCKLIDDFIHSYHEQVLAWEYACLILMSTSVALNFIVIILFLFLCHRLPSLLSAIMTIAFCCSCVVIVIFATYHKSSHVVKNNLMKRFVNETEVYGYSFWIAVAASCLQFVAAFGLIGFVFYACCKRCCNGYR